MKITTEITTHGQVIHAFKDRDGLPCSLQKSALLTNDVIWFGVDDVQPSVLAVEAASVGVATAKTSGYVPYPIPPNVALHTRMHLTRDQVKELLPFLQKFVDTGEI